MVRQKTSKICLPGRVTEQQIELTLKEEEIGREIIPHQKRIASLQQFVGAQLPLLNETEKSYLKENLGASYSTRKCLSLG